MRQVRIITGIGVALLLAVAACNMGVGTLAEGSGRPLESGPTEPFTGARVTIPLVSPGLLSAMNAGYSPSAGGISTQAILFATSAEFTLYQNGAEPIATWVLSDGEEGLTTIGEDGPPRLEAFLAIDAGDGYTLEVTVYNNKVSSVESVVEGKSAEFAITAGVSTSVTIIAVPSNPVIFATDNETDSRSIAQTPYSFLDGGPGEPDLVFTGFGGEAWYELDLTGGADRFVRFRADPDGEADAIILVYDESGRMMEGSNDPPAWSWGFFPSAIGGRGGARAGIIGRIQEDIVVYLGMILANRNGATVSEDVAVTMDILERPFVAYDNAFPAGQEPPGVDDFHLLAPRVEVSQTVFRAERDENGGNGGNGDEGDSGGNGDNGDNGKDDGRLVHWFLLGGIGWGQEGLMETLPITVEITFDVLESGHLLGFDAREVNGDFAVEDEMLLVLVGDPEGDSPPDLYRPIDDPEFVVTENPDGSTTLVFTVHVATEGNAAAGVAVSSRYAGNRFTLKWNAPGEAAVGVE